MIYFSACPCLYKNNNINNFNNFNNMRETATATTKSSNIIVNFNNCPITKMPVLKTSTTKRRCEDNKDAKQCWGYKQVYEVRGASWDREVR